MEATFRPPSNQKLQNSLQDLEFYVEKFSAGQNIPKKIKTYRIIQRGGHYLVERKKKFIFWEYWSTLSTGGEYGSDYHFSSIEKAEEWIKGGCRYEDYYPELKRTIIKEMRI